MDGCWFVDHIRDWCCDANESVLGALCASNFNILLIAEVAVVFLFSMRTYKANVMSLYAMFFIYSALNGVTLSLVSLAYGIMEATVPALIGALAFFVAFSIVGLTTKKNLAGLTPYLVVLYIWYDYRKSRVYGDRIFRFHILVPLVIVQLA